MGTVLEQMEITAARNGAIATLSALMHRKQTGEAQHIDVSTMEATVSTPSGLIHPYSFTGRSPKRGGSDGNVMDGMHLFTKDGEVTLTTAGTGGRPMEAWAEFLEEPSLLDPKFAGRRGRMENWEELYDLVAPKLAQWNNLDLMEATMARGLVIGLVQNPQQVVESPHLNERGALIEIDHPVNGQCSTPGLDSSWTEQIQWRAAPRSATGRAQRGGLLPGVGPEHRRIGEPSGSQHRLGYVRILSCSPRLPMRSTNGIPHASHLNRFFHNMSNKTDIAR